jgi:hypothetical protein
MPAWYIRRAGLVLVAAVVVPFAGSLLLAQPPGFPRQPTGPGGFGPGSGIPNFPMGPGAGSGIPNIPMPPSSPFDQNNRPGAGQFGGGSRFEWVFTCTNCRKELGRSESAIDKPP